MKRVEVDLDYQNLVSNNIEQSEYRKILCGKLKSKFNIQYSFKIESFFQQYIKSYRFLIEFVKLYNNFHFAVIPETLSFDKAAFDLSKGYKTGNISENYSAPFVHTSFQFTAPYFNDNYDKVFIIFFLRNDNGINYEEVENNILKALNQYKNIQAFL